MEMNFAMSSLEGNMVEKEYEEVVEWRSAHAVKLNVPLRLRGSPDREKQRSRKCRDIDSARSRYHPVALLVQTTTTRLELEHMSAYNIIPPQLSMSFQKLDRLINWSNLNTHITLGPTLYVVVIDRTT